VSLIVDSELFKETTQIVGFSVGPASVLPLDMRKTAYALYRLSHEMS
jgi:hypothetical protein